MGLRTRLTLSALLLLVFCAPGAGAQTLKFCNLRAALSLGQAQFAGGISLYGDSIDQYVLSQQGSDDELTNIKICAKDVRQRLCTDKLMSSLLDPLGQAKTIVGGAIGGKVLLDSPGAGILIGEILGPVKNATNFAICNKNFAEVYEPAMKRLGRIQVQNAGQSSGVEFRKILKKGYDIGRLSVEEFSMLSDFMTQIEAKARESQ